MHKNKKNGLLAGCGQESLFGFQAGRQNGLLFISFCRNAKEKVQDMADPYNGQNDPADGDIFHHDKAKAHKQGKEGQDAGF